MVSGKKIIALIPARGGSKGIKDKNIIDICGKPLIAYSILSAKQSRYIDDVVVTTDSEKIKEVSIQYGADVPFLRPAELADDHSTTLDAVIHALNTLKKEGREYDILILLQPTSPLRTTEDIDSAIERFVNADYKSLVSVSEVRDHPLLMRKLKEDGSMEKIINQNSTVRRQDMSHIYRINGSIYINMIKDIDVETSFADNNISFVMEQSHSVDIDDYSDVALAEYYLKSH